METITKRAKRHTLSGTGEHVLAQYKRRLRIQEDLASVTIRNYLSHLRHFAAWCEFIWKQGREEGLAFTPECSTYKAREVISSNPWKRLLGVGKRDEE